MLSDFREQLSVTWAPKVATPAIIVAPEEAEATSKTSSLSDLLARMESEVAQPQDVSSFVDILFNGIRDKVSADSFGEFYSLKITENSDFEEFETQSFITRVLSKEKRNDEFVTATVKREYKIQNSLTRLTQSLAFPQSPESDYTERLKLKLNLRMDRAQMRLNFTPKFSALQQINLIVSCAPSLETCYLFELATRHPRTDWNNFAEEGVEVTRRWYKLSWHQNVDDLITKIADQLSDVIKQHLEAVAERLTKK